MTFPLNPWTAVEDAILRHEWPDIEKVAARTGRTPDAIRHRAYRLELPPRPPTERVTQWSAEDDERLKQLYGVMSAAKIGEMLGTTKNAVIGRANRLGLSRETQAAITRKANLVLREQEIKKPPLVGTRLVDLERSQCRFALAGHGAMTEFCGNPVKAGTSWCEFHHAKVWKQEGEPSGKLKKRQWSTRAPITARWKISWGPRTPGRSQAKPANSSSAPTT